MFLYLDSDRQCERTSSINLPRAPHKIVHHACVWKHADTRFVTFVQRSSSAPVASGEGIFSRRECINYVVSDLGHRTRAWDSLTGSDGKKKFIPKVDLQARGAKVYNIAFQKCIRCVYIVCALVHAEEITLRELSKACQFQTTYWQILNLIFNHSIYGAFRNFFASQLYLR